MGRARDAARSRPGSPVLGSQMKRSSREEVSRDKEGEGESITRGQASRDSLCLSDQYKVVRARTTNISKNTMSCSVYSMFVQCVSMLMQ